MQLFIPLLIFSSYSLKRQCPHLENILILNTFHTLEVNFWLTWTHINSSSDFLFTCCTPRGGTECEWEPNPGCRGRRLSFWVAFSVTEPSTAPGDTWCPLHILLVVEKFKLNWGSPVATEERIWGELDIQEGWGQWGGTKWHWKHKNFIHNGIEPLRDWNGENKSVDNDEDRKIPWIFLLWHWERPDDGIPAWMVKGGWGTTINSWLTQL